MNFRPSNSDTLKHCRHFESDEAGQAAIYGTRDHRALALNLRGHAASWFVDIPADRAPEIEWFADFVKCNAQKDALQIERKVTLFGPEMEVLLTGTPDAFDDQTLFDYKSGERHDYAAQMACYALAIMQEIDADSLRVCIGYGKSKRVDDYRLTVGEAKAIVDAAMAEANRADKPPVIGHYCSWCASALTCPARVGVVQDALAATFGGSIPAFDPQKLSDPAELSKALVAWKDYLEPWGKRLWDTAKTAAETGADIPGWKLDSREGPSEVTDMARAFQLLALPQDVFLACCKLVQAKAAAALAEVHTLTRHAAAKEVKRRLEPVIVRGEDSVTLKRIEITL